MTRVITLCLVIAIVSTSATACAGVVREINSTEDQTNHTAQTPTPDMAKTAVTYYNHGDAKGNLG